MNQAGYRSNVREDDTKKTDVLVKNIGTEILSEKNAIDNKNVASITKHR